MNTTSLLRHWNLLDPNDQRAVGGDFNDYVQLVQETSDPRFNEEEDEIEEIWNGIGEEEDEIEEIWNGTGEAFRLVQAIYWRV